MKISRTEAKAQPMSDHRPELDLLAQRLVAGRYGELQCLRALAIVEKQAPVLTQRLSQRGSPLAGQPGSGSSSDAAQPQHRPSQVEHEMQQLTASRRVSTLGAFRSRLERILASPQLPAAAPPATRRRPSFQRPADTLPPPRPADSPPPRPADSPPPDVLGGALEGAMLGPLLGQARQEEMAFELQQASPRPLCWPCSPLSDSSPCS